MTDPKTTIDKRKGKNKTQLLDQLKKLPIIEIACEKIGIGRATYYRWRKEDPEFGQIADEALFSGRNLINDMAESQLLNQIKDQNLTAIIFWLKHNHPSYGNKLEVTAKVDGQNVPLTPEQEKLVKESLRLASLIPPETQEQNHE